MRRIVLAVVLLVAFSASAGAPLKGVDVKLGKAPGGGASARTTTNEHGTFSFPVMPRGSYWVSFESKSASPMAEVSVTNGPASAAVRAEWNLRAGHRVGAGTGAAAKNANADKLMIDSDGKNPIQGAVVKSKSNISNN
jgi:hypothetical protein